MNHIQNGLKTKKCIVTEHGVVLLDLPLPPQSNNQYRPIPHFKPGGKISARKVKTRDLQHFEFLFEQYRLENLREFNTCVQALEKYLENHEKMLRVDRFFGFHFHRLISKKKQPKRLDVSNRIKAFDDSLCHIIGIDDKYIWKGSEEKSPVDESQHEQAAVMISPYLPKPYDVLIDGISP